MVKFEGTKFPAGGREQVARAANAVGCRMFRVDLDHRFRQC